MASSSSSNEVRSVADLSACFRPLFAGWRYFNAVQSEAFPVAFQSESNMVRLVSGRWTLPRTAALTCASCRWSARRRAPARR